MEKLTLKNVRFIPTLFTAVLFIFLLFSSLFLFFGRNLLQLRIGWVLTRIPDFYTHISNFSISLCVLIILSLVWLCMDVPLIYLIGLAIFIAAVNMITELWVTVLNVPDIMDAWYGLAGTTVGLLFTLWTKFFGLNRTDISG